MQVFYTIATIFIFIILLRLLFRKVFDLPTYSGKFLTDNSTIENLMPEDKFWQVIDETSKKSKRHYPYQCQLITEYLDNLDSQEIVQFDRTFSFLLANSYSFRLWEAAYSLNGGCSDDAFEHFRTWLIAQGKNKFYWTIKFPRLLFLVGVKELIENYQGIGYCAYNAFQNKTGRDIPQSQDIEYPDPGEKFGEVESILRYPELMLLAW